MKKGLPTTHTLWCECLGPLSNGICPLIRLRPPSARRHRPIPLRLILERLVTIPGADLLPVTVRTIEKQTVGLCNLLCNSTTGLLHSALSPLK